MVKRPVAFLLGDETALVDDIIRRTQAAMFADSSGRDLNCHIYNAQSDSPHAAIEQSQTAPFLAEKRLIVFRSVDRLTDKGRQALARYLETGPKYAVWLLVFSDAKKASMAVWKKISPKAETLYCQTPYKESDIRRRLRDEFKQRETDVEAEALTLLLERTGKNLSELLSRVEQLSLLAAERKTVTVADVDRLVGANAEENAFELYAAIADGNADEALKITRHLESEGHHAIEILGALGWQYDRHLKLRNMLDRGLGRADAARELRIPGFFLNAAIDRSRRRSEERVFRDMKTILESDTAVKTGRLAASSALNDCILKLLD